MAKNQFERIEDGAFKIKNEMQLDLACEAVNKKKVSGEEFEAWSQKHSADFREIIESRSDLLSLYASDKKKALEEIKNLLQEQTE